MAQNLFSILESLRTRRVILIVFLLPALLYGGGCGYYRVASQEPLMSGQEHWRLGLVYEKQGKLDQAARHYRHALKAGAEPGKIYFRLGNVAFQKNELITTASLYKKSLNADPSNPEVHNNLAWVYAVQGKNWKTAEKHARRAIALAPPPPPEEYEHTLQTILKKKSPPME